MTDGAGGRSRRPSPVAPDGPTPTAATERRDCANATTHEAHEWMWDGGRMWCEGKPSAAQGRFWNDHNLVREWSAHRRVFWIKNGWHWGWTGGTWRVLELGKVRVWL